MYEKRLDGWKKENKFAAHLGLPQGMRSRRRCPRPIWAWLKRNGVVDWELLSKDCSRMIGRLSMNDPLSAVPRITPADLTIFDWCQACGQEER